MSTRSNDPTSVRRRFSLLAAAGLISGLIAGCAARRGAESDDTPAATPQPPAANASVAAMKKAWSGPGPADRAQPAAPTTVPTTGATAPSAAARRQAAQELLESLRDDPALAGAGKPDAAGGEAMPSILQEPSGTPAPPRREPPAAVASGSAASSSGGNGGGNGVQDALDEIARALQGGAKDPAPPAPAPAPAPPPAPASEPPSAPAPAPAAAAQEGAAPAAAAPEAAAPTRSPPPAAPEPAGQPPAAAPPAAAAAAAPQSPPAQQPPQRPAGKTVFYTFFHKNASDFVSFLRNNFPEIFNAGHAAPVEGKARTVIFFGEDPMIQQLTGIADEFDDLELKLERTSIRPKYMDAAILMESLNMAGLANVWARVDETVTVQQPQGNNIVKLSQHKQSVYAKGGLAAGQSAPVAVPPKVPYIFEMPFIDPFQIPRQSTGKGQPDQLTLDFTQTSSTERRGAMVAVGTAEDLERIAAFVDSIDRPARQIMIEVQLIELDANAFSDLGIDAIQFGQRHSIVNFGGPFPGEAIKQPGLGETFRRPGVQVPPVVDEGLAFLFDDTSVDVSGRFLSRIHALVRTGDATIKARPKILTLDDRPSILHIGEEVPSFESTGVSRDVTGGNFVEQVNRVTTQYVGFTLNMRPKIAGDSDDEVAIQLEVVSNQLQGRERVFAEDLLGIPIIARRRFIGQSRVKNHRPIILGGLIQEEEVESTSKVPFIGEVPYIGRLFSRVQRLQRRTEIILVVTPHVLSEKGVDRVATPKESVHFDTFDSVLFNDRHIIKGRDVWGIDPITKQPAMVQGDVFSEDEVIDLTLLNIVKQRNLVSKLGVFEEYVPEEAEKLSWLQRKYPERSVRYWPDDLKEIYFKAAAIVIENIKELNPDLTYEDLVTPRREIVLPTTPYRMTLSYDKYKTLVEKGKPVLRGERVELSEATVALLRDAGMQRTMRHWADYIERNGIRAEDHGELRAELLRLYLRIQPESNAIQTDNYVEFFRELDKAKIGFIAVATYFQENLNDRYRVGGPPNIGAFEQDIKNFLKTTVTITQRAKRLLELDSKWTALASDDAPATAESEESQ